MHSNIFKILGLILVLSRSAFGSPASWGGTTSLSRTNSLYNRQDGSEIATVGAALAVTYAKKDWATSLALEASQDLQRQEESDLSYFQVGIKRKNIEILSGNLILIPGAGFSIPVSRDQRLRQSLILGTNLNLRSELNQNLLPNKRWNVAFSLSGTRNFHTYEQKTDGSVNTQYTSHQGFDTGYQVSEKISLSLALHHIDTFSYFGGHREFYSHSEEVGFQVIKATTLSLGHQLGVPAASIRKTNGEDYNFQLTDETQSLVYIALSLNY